MRIEHDFTRPYQPDDPGVEYVKTIERTRFAFWGFVAIAAISILALVWTFIHEPYPVLKKSDRVVVCGEVK